MDDQRIRETLKKQALQRAIGEIEAAKATYDMVDDDLYLGYSYMMQEYDELIEQIKKYI